MTTTKTLLLLAILFFAFSCKKADPKKDMEVVNIKELYGEPIPVTPVAPYTVTSKATIASTSSAINDLTVANSDLYLVGSFTSLGTANSRCIVKYNGASLLTVPTNLGISSNVRAINYFNGRYVIGGYMNTTSSSTFRNLGYFSGTTVTTYSLMTGQVYSLYSEGQSYCYAGGNVTSANNYSTSVGRVTTGFSLFGSFYGSVSSFTPYVYTMSYFNNYLFLGGSLSGSNDKNIVYSDGGSWQKSGSGFNNTVNDLINFDGKLYAGGAMTYDGYNTTPMNYVNHLFTTGSWQKTGTANLPALCYSLEVHKDQLIACGSNGNTGYLYRYNKSNNTWENCLGSGITVKSLQKICSFNDVLYGLEKDLTSGQTNFVRFN